MAAKKKVKAAKALKKVGIDVVPSSIEFAPKAQTPRIAGFDEVPVWIAKMSAEKQTEAMNARRQAIRAGSATSCDICAGRTTVAKAQATKLDLSTCRQHMTQVRAAN